MRRTTGERGSRAATIVSAVLLVVAVLAAALQVLVSYGFMAEYAELDRSDAQAAADGLLTWGPFAVVVAGFAFGAALVAPPHRRRLLTGLAAGLTALTLVAVGVAAALGTRAKAERMVGTPDCGGPVVLQEAVREIEHPARFSGEGESTAQHCSLRLASLDEAATERYREALGSAGWDVQSAAGEEVRAARGDLVFLLERRGDDYWVTISQASAD